MRLCIVKISDHCDLNCIHCYLKTHQNRTKEINIEEAEILFNYLSKLQIDIVGLEGNHTDIVSIIKIATKNKLKTTISVSPYSINEEIIDSIKEDVGSIVYSIDGHSPNIHDKIRGKSGVFDLTINQINYAINVGIEISVTCAISKLNYEQIDGIIELCEGIGIKRIAFLYTTPIGYAKEHNLSLPLDKWEKICDKIRNKSHSSKLNIYFEPVFCDKINNKSFCSANSCQYLSVDSYGFLYFCPILIGQKEYSIGNIYNGDLFSLKQIKSKGLSIINNRKSKIICSNCSTSSSCLGECFLHSSNIIVSDFSIPKDKFTRNKVPLCYIYWEGLNYDK